MSMMLLMAPCKLSPDRKVPGSPTVEDAESEVLRDEAAISWVTSGGVAAGIVGST